MSRHRSLGPVLVGSAILLAACAGRPAQPQAAPEETPLERAGATTPTTVESVAEEPSSSTTTLTGETTAGRRSSPVRADEPSRRPRTRGEAAPRPTPGTTEGIVTSVQPPCPRRGEVVRVTITTVAFADVSHAVTFSDGDSHGLYGLGQADERGMYVWAFTVPAAAAPGDARVMAAALHPQRGGGSGMGTFRVVDGGECEP